jgi:hypothetical protein
MVDKCQSTGEIALKAERIGSACDWLFPLFRRAIACGHYPSDWGRGEKFIGAFGERPEG